MPYLRRNGYNKKSAHMYRFFIKVILSVFGGFVGYLLCIALLAIKDKLPKFMKSDAFLNLVIIILVILIVLYSVDINILNYL